MRAGKLDRAFRRARYALRRAFTGQVHFSLNDGVSRQAEALVLITPKVSKAMHDEVALEVAGLDVHSAQETFRLAVNGLFGDWRRDPGVTTNFCTRGRVRAKHAIPCILDGEMQWLPRKVAFEFVPHAFRALAPPPAPRADA